FSGTGMHKLNIQLGVINMNNMPRTLTMFRGCCLQIPVAFCNLMSSAFALTFPYLCIPGSSFYSATECLQTDGWYSLFFTAPAIFDPHGICVWLAQIFISCFDKISQLLPYRI